jgi:hypothetical protein
MSMTARVSDVVVAGPRGAHGVDVAAATRDYIQVRQPGGGDPLAAPKHFLRRTLAYEGVKGDGVTNDGPAIRAVNALGAVYETERGAQYKLDRALDGFVSGSGLADPTGSAEFYLPAAAFNNSSGAIDPAGLTGRYGNTGVGLRVLGAQSASKVLNISAIAKGATTAVTVAGTNTLLKGERVSIAAVLGMSEINLPYAVVILRVAGQVVTLDLDSRGFSDYASGGTLKSFTPLKNVLIEGLRIRKEYQDGTIVRPIFAQNIEGLIVRGCDITGLASGMGICLSGCPDALVEQNHIHDTWLTSAAIGNAQVTGIEWDNDRVNNLFSNGFMCRDNDIHNLEVGGDFLDTFGYQTDAIHVVGDYVRDWLISGNRTNFVGEAMDIYNGPGTITKNLLLNSKYFAIKLIYRANNILVSNNVIEKAGGHAIFIYGGGAVAIHGNMHVIGNKITGIDPDLEFESQTQTACITVYGAGANQTHDNVIESNYCDPRPYGQYALRRSSGLNNDFIDNTEIAGTGGLFFQDIVGTGTFRRKTGLYYNVLTAAEARANLNVIGIGETADQPLRTTIAASGSAIVATSESNDTASGPNLVLIRDRDAETTDSPMGAVSYQARDAGGALLPYVRLGAILSNPALGARHAEWDVQIEIGDVLTTVARFSHGLVVGTPAGSFQGLGTGNFNQLFENGNAVTCAAAAADFWTTGKIDVARFDALMPDIVVPDRIERTAVMEEVEIEDLDRGDDGVHRLRKRKKKMPRMQARADGKGEEPVHEERLIPGEVITVRNEAVHHLQAMLDDGFDPRDPDNYFARAMRDEAVPGLATQAEWAARMTAGKPFSLGETHGRQSIGLELLMCVVRALHEGRKADAARIDALERAMRGKARE